MVDYQGVLNATEAMMEKRTDDFDSLKTEELQTQWKHKISVVPESADGGGSETAITTKWWTFTSGVSRTGPEAEIPAGETITSDQSGDYVVGTPALAGGAARVEGTAQDGDNDDWWTGFTNRINVADADDDGVGIGYKYFSQGDGALGGADSDGDQEYVWFRSGVSGVDDVEVPRDQWNGVLQDLIDDGTFTTDLSKGNLFHSGGFNRIDFTFYNQGAADVNWGVKTDDGKIHIITLHSFNQKGDPMWKESDLKWQMGTEGVNLTGYINAAHYKGGNSRRLIRFAGSGRDGTVLGSTLSLTQGVPVPVLTIQAREGWESVNVSPISARVECDDSFYLFISTNSSLQNADFIPPLSEAPTIDPADSEYAVLVDNDADGFSDIGEVEEFEYIPGTGTGVNAQAQGNVEAPDFALSPGENATVGIVPIDASSFEGASFQWGSNF